MAVTVKEWNGGRKGGEQAWWVFVNYDGARKSKRIGVGKPGKEAAQEVAKRVAAQIALGDLTFLQTRPEAPSMFSAYAEQWLATSVKGRLKAGTAEWYERTITNHWTPMLGRVSLPQISREVIKRTLGQWLTDGAKTRTVQGRLAVLAACLGSAVEDGAIQSNPAAKLAKWARRSDEQAKVVETFTREELRAILETAEREKCEWSLLFLTLARTGLRIGEALTLRWDDLDLPGRALTVRRTWGLRKGQGTMNTPKGNRERRVDVSDQLAETLIKRRDRLQVEALTSGRESEPEWVFPGADGRPIKPGAFWQNLWGPVLKAAGVRYRNPHTLRHTFASQLLANGESLVYVKEQLGHSSIRITVDTYGHLVPGSNRQAVNKLDDVEVAL